MDPRLVDNRNRVALPREVLEALGLESGDYVSFAVEGGVVRLHKLDITVAHARR